MDFNQKLNSVIGILIEEETISEMTCPFCGASEDNIETFELDSEINYESADANETSDDIETLNPINNSEFKCSACNNSWVIDEDGNYYELEIDENITEAVVGKRVRKRAKKKSSSQQRMRNIKQGKLKAKKSVQGARLAQRVAGSSSKKVVFRDGKFVIVKKDIKGRVKKLPTKNESLAIKPLDESFGMDGRLINYIDRTNNPSNFEQKIKNYMNENKSWDISSLTEYIKESYPEESEYIGKLYRLFGEKKYK